MGGKFNGKHISQAHKTHQEGEAKPAKSHELEKEKTLEERLGKYTHLVLSNATKRMTSGKIKNKSELDEFIKKGENIENALQALKIGERNFKTPIRLDEQELEILYNSPQYKKAQEDYAKAYIGLVGENDAERYLTSNAENWQKYVSATIYFAKTVRDLQEKIREHEAEKQTPVVKLIGSEFKGETLEEKRKEAENFFEKNLKNKSFQNKYLGNDIKVLGYHKAKSQAFSVEKINLIKHLPLLLQNGIPFKFRADEKNRPNVKGFYYLKSKIDIKGKSAFVVLSVRLDNNGNVYYNHILEKETEETVSLPTPSVGAPVSSVKSSIADNAGKVKAKYDVTLFIEG